MILKILTEAKSKNYPEVVAALKAKDPFFAKLVDVTINDIIKVYLKDVVIEGDINPDDILEWFHDGANTWDFIYNYGQDLTTFSIYNLIKADPELTQYITDYAIATKLIDENGKDLMDPYSDKNMSLQDIVSWIFRWNVTNPVYTVDDMERLVAKTLKDNPGMKKPEAMNKIYNSPSYGSKEEINPSMLEEVLDDVNFFILNGDLRHLTKQQLKDLKAKQEEDRLKILKPLNIKEAKEDEVEEEIPEEEVVEDEISLDEIPAEEEVTIEEPIEEVKPEITQTAFSQIVLDAIQKEWDLISQINSIIATIDYEYKEENKDDIIKVLNGILDDSTINVGMLHKVTELISQGTSDLISAGAEKAEEIINQ